MTSHWLLDHLRADGGSRGDELPLITLDGAQAIAPGLRLWDFWPVYDPAGRVAVFENRALWMALSAPEHLQRDDRHGHARIRLLSNQDGVWRDEGDLMPDGFSSGSREWSGSALFDPATRRLILYYTAAGVRGEAQITMRQRIMQACGSLVGGRRFRVETWTDHREIVEADGSNYAPAHDATGQLGFITAFRDPFHFADPETGQVHLLFAASSPTPGQRFNGVVGIATADGSDGWRLGTPLISALGVNSELERPHIVHHAGRYYLFWSTQTLTFHPAIRAPNGLYGMVAEALAGPYRPLNGSGLVLRNPAEAPSQNYAWQVLNDLSVVSFLDLTKSTDNDELIFAGAFAPVAQLSLAGDRTRLLKPTAADRELPVTS